MWVILLLSLMDPLLMLGKLLFAAALGGLVGIEREFNRREQKSTPIGVRTMILFCVLGVVIASFRDYFDITFLVITGLVGIIVLSILFLLFSHIHGYNSFEEIIVENHNYKNTNSNKSIGIAFIGPIPIIILSSKKHFFLALIIFVIIIIFLILNHFLYYIFLILNHFLYYIFL